MNEYPRVDSRHVCRYSYWPGVSTVSLPVHQRSQVQCRFSFIVDAVEHLVDAARDHDLSGDVLQRQQSARTDAARLLRSTFADQFRQLLQTGLHCLPIRLLSVNNSANSLISEKHTETVLLTKSRESKARLVFGKHQTRFTLATFRQ